MTIEAKIPVEDRILQVIQHIGIEKAHFAGSLLDDWTPLVSRFPEVLKSLILSSSMGLSAQLLAPIESRVLLFSGDSGPNYQSARNGTAGLRSLRHHVLHNYEQALWSDIVADRTDEVVAAMKSFVDEVGGLEPLEHSTAESTGEFLEITYRVRGSGPPLVLLPIELAPSQWESAIPRLAENFTTIVLGGRHLGMVQRLEQRAVDGFQEMIHQIVNRLSLLPGDRLLDIGCGTGAHDRYISRLTKQDNPIVGVDHSNYMITEAVGIARSEGLEDALEFREGDATNLPFEDDSFDGAVSITVMEEVDADRMLSEMVRVVKPGARVAVVIRAVDLPWIVNAPFPDEIKHKVEAPNVMGAGTADRGCADASLYSRMKREGLMNLQMFPQFMTFPGRQNWESQARGALPKNEARVWDEALEKARSQGTFFISQPFHCAIGTKPV